MSFLVLCPNRSLQRYRFSWVVPGMRPRLCIKSWLFFPCLSLDMLPSATRSLLVWLALHVWIPLVPRWPWVLIVLLAGHLMTVLTCLVVGVEFGCVSTLDYSTHDTLFYHCPSLTVPCDVFIAIDCLFCWSVTACGNDSVVCGTELLSKFPGLELEVLFFLFEFKDRDGHIGWRLWIFIFRSRRWSEPPCFVNLPRLSEWSLNWRCWCIFVHRPLLVRLICFDNI